MCQGSEGSMLRLCGGFLRGPGHSHWGTEPKFGRGDTPSSSIRMQTFTICCLSTSDSRLSPHADTLWHKPFAQGRPKSLPTLTHHGGLFEKLEAGFKCHLLQRGGT